MWENAAKDNRKYIDEQNLDNVNIRRYKWWYWLCPEYLPVQTIADFRAAEQKLKTEKDYMEKVVNNI